MSLSAMKAASQVEQRPVGTSIPPFTPHAISVSLPTWLDNTEYEEGAPRVVNAMETGYPRFFIHLQIQQLTGICEQKFGVPGEKCLLVPTKVIAQQCRAFMINRSSLEEPPVRVRLIELLVQPGGAQVDPQRSAPGTALHIVLFPATAFPIAKQFWQHTGLGISSRRAAHCLSMMPEEPTAAVPSSPTISRMPTKSQNKHYSVKTRSPPQTPNVPTEMNAADLGLYVEERYGRNLPISYAASAKRTLRRRIAGVLIHDDLEMDAPLPEEDFEVRMSTRGVASVTENDVYLFPTGMGAIWTAHQSSLAVKPSGKSVCFGFPYTDTLKILQKWGPGCHFLGHGLDPEIEELEAILEKGSTDPSVPPVLALFTEFPSNPMLRSANLPRLRALADKYDFLIIIDETLGNFVNVEVLPYADIVVSSLSKIFSGDANVMGGSLVINPKGRHYTALKEHLSKTYEPECCFDEDVIFMERNSRNFRRRIGVVDRNAVVVCDYLYSNSVAGGAKESPIKGICYPKWSTPENYETCRIKTPGSEGGYGGLFSLTFTSLSASKAFFDMLKCFKGPSLGTNFTLASPYSILAHYTELPWASQYGVEEGLVRVSVGMEGTSMLLDWFRIAFEASKNVVA